MPTRTEYINYVHSTIGPKGVGRAENDVPDNEWYYRRRVSGSNFSWCLVKECHDMDHFGILTLNGGKAAYVPNMPAIAKKCGAKVWHKPERNSKAYQPGNRIGFDFNHSDRGNFTDAEHTGTFWKERDASTFWSIDGNTGDDEVAARVRYYSDVLFVVETLGLDGDNAKDDDVPDYVSLSTKEPVNLEVGKEVFVKWDVEVSDKAKRHNDAGTEGIFVAGKNGSVYLANVYEFTGPATWELCEMRKDDGEWVQHDHSYTGGVDVMDAGNHLWLKLHPTGTGVCNVSVKCAIWDR